jgi:adenylate kinase
MLNIVLFGPPGSGKGTQAENLISKYNLMHISTGDLLRSEIGNQTELGVAAKQYMDEGKLVPDEVVIGMIQSKLGEMDGAAGVIFDGFPRTTAQAEALDTMLTERSIPISGCLAMEVSNEELTQRILKRGETSGRSDDSDESIIRSRIDEYNSKTAPVANYYEGQGKFASIHGEGSIDEIFDRLCTEIDKLN